MSDCKCKDKGNDCDKGACRGSRARDENMLARFRRCEPFCDSGGCTPLSVFPAPNPCDDGVCDTSKRGDGAVVTLAERDDVLMLLHVGVRAGLFALCIDPATGRPGFGLPGGPCIVTEDDCKLCRVFGPHYNAQVRDSKVSPAAAKAIANGYRDEDMSTEGADAALLGPFALPDHPGWYYVIAGSIGVSHQFCLDAFGVTLEVADVPTPLTVTRLAVAGTRIVCDPDRPGFYQEVFGPSTSGAAADITGEPRPNMASCVRRCKPICATTPAEGGEVFFFQVAENGGVLTPEQLALTEVSLHVERCKFLCPVEWCVAGRGELVPVPEQTATLTFTVPERAGTPSYLP